MSTTVRESGTTPSPYFDDEHEKYIEVILKDILRLIKKKRRPSPGYEDYRRKSKCMKCGEDGEFEFLVEYRTIGLCYCNSCDREINMKKE